jgi:hypothetical protein
MRRRVGTGNGVLREGQCGSSLCGGVDSGNIEATSVT